MKTKFLIAILIITGLGITTADAQIKHRAQNQHQRIKHGVKSGDLTRAEALNLRKDQKEFRGDAKLAKADGKISRKERKILKREQRKDSREIYRKKHNKRERH